MFTCLFPSSPIFPPSCMSHLKFLAPPTRREHERTFIRPSRPVCARHLPESRVLAHPQVRDPSRAGNFVGHGKLQRHYQLFPRTFFMVSLNSTIRTDVTNSLQFSTTVNVRLFSSSIFFNFVETFCTHLTKLLVINSRARMLLGLWFMAHQTACNLFGIVSLHTCCELGKTSPWPQQFSVTFNVPMIVDATFQQRIQCRISQPDKIGNDSSFVRRGFNVIDPEPRWMFGT